MPYEMFVINATWLETHAKAICSGKDINLDQPNLKDILLSIIYYFFFFLD